MMKAGVFKKYGIENAKVVDDVPKPKAGKKDVLVEVRSTSVTTGDWRSAAMIVPYGFGWIMRLMIGVTAPRGPGVFGQEFAGVVTEVGGDAGTEFKVGDEVFGTNDVNFGAHAEYIAVASDYAIARMPGSDDDNNKNNKMAEYGAIAFGGLTSLYFLRDMAALVKGDKVLITGASGCLGTFGIQLAKHYGAHVTAVCSGKNEKLVRSLGADDFIDYTTTADVAEWGGGAGDDGGKKKKKYDYIYDTVGKVKFADAKGIMTENGQLLAAAFESVGVVCKILANSMFGGKQKFRTGTPPIGNGSKKDLEFLSKLVEEGKLKVVVDTKFPLDKIADAFALVHSGHKRGSCVVTVKES